MRAVVAFCLLTGPMFYFGWPAPWWSVPLAFVFGMAGRGPLTAGRSPRRGGYLTVPASPNGKAGTAERVGTYTGFSTAGQSQGDAAPSSEPAERSSDGGPTGYAGGRSGASVMGGFRGLELAASAGFDWSHRAELYRLRLTPAQRIVFDQLADEARALGNVPPYAYEAMAPHSPWPDPCEGS